MKKSLMVFCLAVAFGAAAGTITETTTDETASGDWEVTVAAGDSNVVTVAQSGSGKIIKKGGGYLVLRKNSTFTGGVEIQAGFVMADPDADAGTSGTVNCTALGMGDVTILGQRGDYTGYCELGIVGAGKDDTRIVTLTNNINVTGNTTGSYPAIVLYGQNSVLSGKITADQDFVFWDDNNSTKAISSSQYNRYDKVLSCTFGEIEATGSVGYSGFCRFLIKGAMRTPKLDLAVTRPRRTYDVDNPDVNNSHGAFVFFATNSIGEIVNGRRHVYCAAPDVLPGVLFRHTKRTGITGSIFHLHNHSPATGYNQTIGGLVSDPLVDGASSSGTGYDWGVTAASLSKTLTIKGVEPDEGETTKELVTCASLNGQLSILLDAYDGFTQTVSNRMHGISKTIHVKKGAFHVTGTATMSNLTAIVVDAGASFRFDSPTIRALESLRTLSVEGTFVVADTIAADALRTNMTEMTLSSSATFTVPHGTHFTTTKLYVDGRLIPIGVWSHAQFPVIPEGVTIACTSGPTAATQTLEWSGAAASDNLMSTPGNWKGSPASIDLSHYALGVTIKGDGEEMVYEDGTKIYDLMFRRTPASTPFTIRPATPGAVLEIAGRIEVTNAAQLILKDITIGTSSRADQGAPSASSTLTMLVRMLPNEDVTNFAESNHVYWSSGVKNLPLVLDNAVIEKPFYSIGDQFSGYQLIYCRPNTTNEFKGQYYHASYWPYFTVDTNAVLTFSGGFSAQILMRKMGNGTMVIKNKPLTSPTYFGIYDGKLVLDAENFSLGGTSSGEGMMLERSNGDSELEFLRSYCFNGDTALIIPFSNSRIGLVEFHSTTQRVTRLHGNASSANVTMHGDPGALFEVMGGRTDMAYVASGYSYKPLTNRVDLTGALSFKLSATNETMTFYAKAFSTCGDLEVSAGTLDFRSDASWLNGTNVAVNGEGRLKVAKGGTFGAKFAELSLADEGVFEIPSGQSQTFLSVTTNGVILPSGRYTSLPNGEGDFLAGGGEIVIRRKGIVITLQ